MSAASLTRRAAAPSLGMRPRQARCERRRSRGEVTERKTSAASAMTTSRSMAGAARRSITFCASTMIFPAPRSSGSKETTAAPGTSWPRPRHLIAHNEGRLGKTLRTEDVLGEKVQVTGGWDSEEEARSIGEEIEQLQRDAREQGARPSARRDRHSGARLVPDARIRRPLHPARPALSRHRRPAVLRARRNPRRAGLFARDRAAGRRPRLRAHRQRAQARPRRRHRADAARLRAQAAHSADRSGRRAVAPPTR